MLKKNLATLPWRANANFFHQRQKMGASLFFLCCKMSPKFGNSCSFKRLQKIRTLKSFRIRKKIDLTYVCKKCQCAKQKKEQKFELWLKTMSIKLSTKNKPAQKK
jgi:hypothetical protein